MSALPQRPPQEWPEPGPAPAMNEAEPGRMQGLSQAARRLGPVVAFGVLPVALLAYFLAVIVPPDSLGLDFRMAFWPAAHDVLQGDNPYPALNSQALADRTGFVYPPIVAIALAPLGLIPVGIATAFAMLSVVIALAAALWILEVRDWRCYGVTLASPAVLGCIQTAALSALFALAIAAAWRCRERGWVTPVMIIAVIAAKLFLWPLLVWLAIVRGIRCAVGAGLAAVALIVVPWLLGFPGAEEYPRLLARLTDLEETFAWTPRALALSLGLSSNIAAVSAVAAGGTVLAIAVAVRRRAHAERRTLVLALLAALLLSPLVWIHYALVLLPSMAIASRRLSWVWFVPYALWFSVSGTWIRPSSAQIAASLVVMTLMAVLALRVPRPPVHRATPRIAAAPVL